MRGNSNQGVATVSRFRHQGYTKRRPHLLLAFVCVQVLWDPFSLQFGDGFSVRQRVRLGEEVAHQLVVVGDGLAGETDGVGRHAETNELGGHGPSLVHQLVERVLPVGARLTENDLAAFVRQRSSIQGHLKG